jgi:hypothetical protein
LTKEGQDALAAMDQHDCKHKGSQRHCLRHDRFRYKRRVAA